MSTVFSGLNQPWMQGKTKGNNFLNCFRQFYENAHFNEEEKRKRASWFYHFKLMQRQWRAAFENQGDAWDSRFRNQLDLMDWAMVPVAGTAAIYMLAPERFGLMSAEDVQSALDNPESHIDDAA